MEAGSYAARMGVNATFMYAFHIPVSLQNVFLIVAATSISSTVALFPGAVGAQTALANVVLRDVASADAISAYSVGQSLIVTAWSVAFGPFAEITETPTNAGYCHCTRCQRRTGTAASAQARIPPGALRVTSGQELVTAYAPGDGGFEKLFCSGCGSACSAGIRSGTR